MSGAFDDVELDELTRQITEKWLSEAPPRTAFDREDLAIAAKLMGDKEASRLGDLKPGERFFPQRARHQVRPARTTSLVRYFFIPAAPGVYTSYTGWTIEVVEGRHKRTLYHSLGDAKAAFCIKELERLKYRPELFVTETMKRAGIAGGPTPGMWPDEPRPARRSQTALHSIDELYPSRGAVRPMAKSRQQRSKRFEIMDQLKGFKR